MYQPARVDGKLHVTGGWTYVCIDCKCVLKTVKLVVINFVIAS